VYIEACESGSLFDGFPTDLGIYAVTAVNAILPSLGTYCTYHAQVNGTKLNTCLGDLFAVSWMQYVREGNGAETMQTFFNTVAEQVGIQASLHYSHEENMQYGDLSIASMTMSEFFYPDKSLASVRTKPNFNSPTSVFSAPRLDMDRRAFMYSDASAMPTYRSKQHAKKMKFASKQLQKLAARQEMTQDLYWALIENALPNSDELQDRVWKQKLLAKNPACEVVGHNALVQSCKGKVDVTSSFALQFHQVLVNLCSIPRIGWSSDPTKAASAARMVCSQTDSNAVVLV